MRIFGFILISLAFFSCSDRNGGRQGSQSDLPEPYLLKDSLSNSTPTYNEVISYWKALASASSMVEIEEFGMTDKGLPLHLVHLGDAEGGKRLKTREKPVLLINNAIHPGEPDGIDASMLLAYDLIKSNSALLREVDIRIIPIFNVGGALNRNSASRANQNGPEEYGFRGNAQNLDLNRDFAKMDSRNAFAFAELIDKYDPDFYVETHVSNGADYSYAITYLASQEDKLDPPLGDFMRMSMTPSLREEMLNAQFDMVPYVNVHGTPPDNGYETFYDSPRYSSGLLSLLQIPGYITETHMLKPYGLRVESTRQFLHAVVKQLSESSTELLLARERARNAVATSDRFNLDWEVDRERADTILFKGYEAAYKPSPVSGTDRLYYDRDRPFERMIPYYAYMKPVLQAVYPKAYVMKRGFIEVEGRLAANGVEFVELERDTALKVEVYHIDTFSTMKKPYEGHYMHYQTSVKRDTTEIRFEKGDLIVPLDTRRKRLVGELLEPESPDSYFNWNYFDAILQQKEWYSPYVFEDKALEILDRDTALATQFKSRMKDPRFAGSPRARIHWVYTHSEHYESEHLRYPVFRILE